MFDIFFKELSAPKPEIYVAIGFGNHGVQIGAMLAGIEKVLLKEKPN